MFLWLEFQQEPNMNIIMMVINKLASFLYRMSFLYRVNVCLHISPEESGINNKKLTIFTNTTAIHDFLYVAVCHMLTVTQIFNTAIYNNLCLWWNFSRYGVKNISKYKCFKCQLNHYRCRFNGYQRDMKKCQRRNI